MTPSAMRLFSVAGIAVSAAVPASAAVVLSIDTPTGRLESPHALEYAFQAPAGSALAAFTITGFASLDGSRGNADPHNYIDRFFLSLNGTDLLSGSYDLGGGGSNVTFFAPTGSLVHAVSNGHFAGGTATFQVPLLLDAGLNRLGLRYEGARQGLRDESWALSSLQVTGTPGVVPEPATWVMLVAGFGLIGAAMRRRKPIYVSN